VSVDGGFVADVDTFAPAEQAQAVVFTASGLTEGAHTLTVEVTGQRNPSAIDSLVVVDAFDVGLSPSAPSITRVQETNAAVTYTGPWTPGTGFKFWSGQTVALSGTAGAQASFTFTGTAVRWIGDRSFNGGIARVLLDGVEVAQVDTFAPVQEEYQGVRYSVAGLTDGTHTLTIEATGLKNPSAFNAFIFVDAFDTH
jgi:hypothetical protein